MPASVAALRSLRRRLAMRRLRNPGLVWAVTSVMLVTTVPGCHMRKDNGLKTDCGDDCYHALATQIEYPEVTQCTAVTDDGWASIEPLTLASTGEIQYWDMSLEEVVQLALAQSKVIRDLGGAVLRQPASAETQYPWCARYNESTVGATNCGFTSLQQCREATFGVGGGCYRNPAYQPPERPRRR